MPDPKLGTKQPLDPNDPNPCSGCSYCCEYISLEIDKPVTVKDFDHVYWFLIHKDVWIYIDTANDWYIQFNTPCEKLQDQRCSHYPHRPMICREYEPRGCSRYGGEEDEKFLFKNERDLFSYLARKRPVMFSKLKEKTGSFYELDDFLEENA